MTAPHDNEVVYRRLLATLNRADIGAAVHFFTDDGVVVEHSDPGIVHSGRAAIAELLRSFFDVVPDLNLEIADMVSYGDRLAAELVMRGTPAGRSTPFEMQFGAYYRFRNGRIVAEHLYVDSAQLPAGVLD